mmetsp:Transcript_3493/g.5045  ORF Transcript_3493/g.5045 Transcript_3493/m.5045 type:complete len:252 (-) Transcript_3493:35-790(-)
MSAAAGAIVTVASVSAMGVSFAYQLTRVMLYKAVEGAANSILTSPKQSPGRVQFILMELDVEAKFKTVKSLLESIENGDVESDEGSYEFVKVCVGNVRDVMETIMITLTRIQDNMDEHARMWFNTWRPLDVTDDLELLKAQCRMFDKRVETLIQCLSIPPPNSDCVSRRGSVASQTGLRGQRIFAHSQDNESEEAGLFEEANRITERRRSQLMADRALEDANLAHNGRDSRSVSTSSGPVTTVVFEDPVFL